MLNNLYWIIMNKSEKIEQLMLDNGCSLKLSEMLEYVNCKPKEIEDYFDDFKQFVLDYALKRFGDIVRFHDMDSDLCDIFERLWDDHYLLGTYIWVDDLVDQIERDGLFRDTIVYYSNAMDWLSEHDCSLKESLEIADEFGCRLKDLSSEVLANLHAERYYMDEFRGYDSEIEELQDNINELYNLFDEIEEIFDEEEEQQTTETSAE